MAGSKAVTAMAAFCADLACAGLPEYRTTYLIEKGIQPRKSDTGWQVEGFDVTTAWHKSLVEISGCALI